jgi:hypothetical protein
VTVLEPFRLPAGWGDDNLTYLMEQAYRNRVATHVNKPEFKRLSAINDCFATISEGWINPQSEIGALLLIRTHAAFFAGCEKAASSSLVECFPQLRAALENAAYALMICQKPELAELWLRRHDTSASKKLVRETFTTRAMRDAVSVADRHAGAIFERLYEECIDYGGHPNERSVTGSLEISRTATGREFRQLWFHGDGLSLDYALMTTSRVGMCALTVLQNAFPGRFELLGVNARMLNLRVGL